MKHFVLLPNTFSRSPSVVRRSLGGECAHWYRHTANSDGLKFDRWLDREGWREEGSKNDGRRWCSKGGEWKFQEENVEKTIVNKVKLFYLCENKINKFSIERTSNYFRHAFVVPACLQHVAWAVTRTHQQHINLSFTFFRRICPFN